MYDAIQKLMMAKKIQYATVLASLSIEYHYTTATILMDRYDRVQLYELSGATAQGWNFKKSKHKQYQQQSSNFLCELYRQFE